MKLGFCPQILPKIYQKNLNGSQSKPDCVSFGVNEDYYYDFSHSIHPIPTKTSLFRNDELITYLPKYLNKNYPEGAKLYNYACSDGSEAYSLLIRMDEQLNEEDKAKFLPIMSVDKSAMTINKAKSRKIKMNLNEIKKLADIKNSDKYFKLQKAFTHFSIYKIQDELFNNVEFRQSDLIKDLDNNKEAFSEPCVLTFKNAWQIYDAPQREKLAEKMYETLKPNSTVVIGHIDCHKGAEYYLKKAGFKQLGGRQPKCFIFTKPEEKK